MGCGVERRHPCHCGYGVPSLVLAPAGQYALAILSLFCLGVVGG
jgi:hypothetical protein